MDCLLEQWILPFSYSSPERLGRGGWWSGVCWERGMKCMQRALSDVAPPPGRTRRAGCRALTFPLCLPRHSWGVLQHELERETRQIVSGAAQSHPLFTLSVHQVTTKCRKLSGLMMLDQPREAREVMKSWRNQSSCIPEAQGFQRVPPWTESPIEVAEPRYLLWPCHQLGRGCPHLLQTKLTRDALAKGAFPYSGH